MNRTMTYLSCAATIAALLTASAVAQVDLNRGPTQTVPTPPSINLTMEHRHILKEGLLKDAKINPETARVRLEPGAVVPTEIPLKSFPEEIRQRVPQIKPYSFFTADNAIVLVQPSDRRIVEVIKG